MATIVHYLWAIRVDSKPVMPGLVAWVSPILHAYYYSSQCNLIDRIILSFRSLSAFSHMYNMQLMSYE